MVRVFRMGLIYYLRLDYGNELVVQRCEIPKAIVEKLSLNGEGRLWFKVLAARERVGRKSRGGYIASLHRKQMKGIVESKRLKVEDLPLYVGLGYISPRFVRLLDLK